MKNLFKAIAEFQQDCPVILKDTSGYGYKYADLTQIDSVIKPLLAKHGLAYVQPLIDDKIKTILFHIDSGEQIESICTIPFDSIKYIEKNGKNIIVGFEGMNTAQAFGSLITYFRRYTISSLLGLITDKDTDGTGLQPEQKQTAPVQTAPVQTAPVNPIIEAYKSDRVRIMSEIGKCKNVEELTIIKESYPDYQKIKDFADALKIKFESFK